MKKGSMTAPIPKDVRNELECDPRMKRCVVGGECSGVIQWHHSQTWKGIRLQEAWSICGICEKHHREEAKYRDVINRDCFNRATDEELERISKAVNYKAERDRLNKNYYATH